jgi:phospholipase C
MINQQKRNNNRQFVRIKNLICLLLFIIIFNFVSCQNEERWYPDADVTIASQHEYSNPATLVKQVVVTCVIHNTSGTTINSGAVTLQVKTDQREYLQTIAVNARIIPGGKIAVNAAITYIDNTEQLQAGGVTVYSSFFD